MDYLRDQLKTVYGSLLACYSGRGGEVWNGVSWVTVGKEEIKNSFRKGDDIKILLCTEAASEGLNLQTSGVLINYDMPWNPMRAEQRIGRIDRIGGHKEVFILNYFYSDTVEAKIYQALSSRIIWFEWVVGELQPILSNVGRTIQEIALTQKDLREVRLEAAIKELNRKCDEQKAQGLNLDEYLADEPVQLKGHGPVTLKELELTLTQCSFLKSCWSRHPLYPNGWMLSLNGEPTPVTFDPELFDQHPETIKFITFGSDVLDKILDQGPGLSKPESLNVPLVRCSSEEPYEAVTYYHIDNENYTPINTLKDFKTTLHSQTSPTIPTETLTRVREDFLSLINEKNKQYDQRRLISHQSKIRVLEDKSKKLLAKFAYCDLVKSQIVMGEDFLAGWDSVPDSEQVVKSLRNKGYPFAPLIRLTQISKLYLRLDDSFYQQIKNLQDKELRSIEENIKKDLKHVVGELATLNDVHLKPLDAVEATMVMYFTSGHQQSVKTEGVF